MNVPIRLTILLGGTVAVAALVYAGGQTPSKSQDTEGVQKAIQFERAKDAADARQARIEAGKAQPASEPKGAVAAGAADRRTQIVAPEDRGMQEAIRFERAKDAADALQSRMEAERPRSTAVARNSAGSANRGTSGPK